MRLLSTLFAVAGYRRVAKPVLFARLLKVVLTTRTTLKDSMQMFHLNRHNCKLADLRVTSPRKDGSRQEPRELRTRRQREFSP